MAVVTFSPNHVPAPACYPADLNALLDALTTGGGLAGTIPDNSGGGIYVGSSAPSSSLTQKVWFKTDGAGRPIQVMMFYNGNWRPVYTGKPAEIAVFSGYWPSYFDGTGLGLIGGQWDGWAICNGQNGTWNLQDRFIMMGEWSGSNWQTAIEGTGNQTSGGAGYTSLTPQNLPYLKVGSYGTPVQAGTGSWGLAGENGVFQNWWQVRDAAGSADLANQSFTNCPPYVVFGYAMFIGYQ